MSDSDPKHTSLVLSLIAEKILRPDEKTFALGVIREHGESTFHYFIEARREQLSAMQATMARQELGGYWTSRNGHGHANTEKGMQS